jgi:hypothetical protein
MKPPSAWCARISNAELDFESFGAEQKRSIAAGAFALARGARAVASGIVVREALAWG